MFELDGQVPAELKLKAPCRYRVSPLFSTTYSVICDEVPAGTRRLLYPTAMYYIGYTTVPSSVQPVPAGTRYPPNRFHAETRSVHSES